MNKKIIFGMAMLVAMIASSCQKDLLQNPNNSTIHTVVYNPVNEPSKVKAINASVFNKFESFDKNQTWFDFTTVSPQAQGQSSNRDAWHLGFYSQPGNITVNGISSNLLVYLNYSVKTQGMLIEGATSLGSAMEQQSKLEGAFTLMNAGTFGMGDLSTFDFHREGQFVIGSPIVRPSSVYLIRTAGAVQVHPDNPTTTNLFLVAVEATNDAYTLFYQGLTRKNANEWGLINQEANKLNIPKSKDYQSRFVNFSSGEISDDIQPKLNEWNLGLSAVFLKRYLNPNFGGGAYAFAVKGVVLNNNPKVQIYRVQSTESNAGAPGPFDPNYTWQNDPALDDKNDITVDFDNYVAANIDDSKFSSNSQEEIGQYFRSLDLGKYRVFVDRFYVIKLQNGDVYKLRFLPLGEGNSSAVNDGIQIKYEKIATSL